MITLNGTESRYYFHEEKGLIRSYGKFNRVFKGYDSLYRPVLIKQLLPELKEDKQAITRFSNEFTLRTTHPNIIAAIDYFEENAHHYIIRKWIEGVDLADKINTFNTKEAVNICMDVLGALKHLHNNGILHLDVQPKNIILGDDKEVYLTDLGLAVAADRQKSRQPFNIYYSAPEQVLNHFELFNETTDLYAVGMILLELLRKTKPHKHHNPEILINLVLALPPVNDARISEQLFAIIKKATSKPRFNLPPSHYDNEELSAFLKAEQANRYLNAGAFINDLLALSDADLKRASWWKFW